MKKFLFSGLLYCWAVGAFAQGGNSSLSYRERLLIRNSEVAEQNLAEVNQIKLTCANPALKSSPEISQFDEISKYADALAYAFKSQLSPLQSYEKIKVISGEIQIKDNLTKYSGAVLQELNKILAKPGKAPEPVIVRLRDYDASLKTAVKNEESFLKAIEESQRTGKFIYDASLYERADILRSYLNSGRDLETALKSVEKPKKYKTFLDAKSKLLSFNSAVDIEFYLKNLDENFANQKSIASNLKMAERNLNQIIEGNTNDEAWRKFGNAIAKDYAEKNFTRYKNLFQKRESYKEEYIELLSIESEGEKTISNEDFDLLYKAMLNEKKVQFDSSLAVWAKSIDFKSAVCAKAFAEKDVESWDDKDPNYINADSYDVYLLYKVKETYFVLVFDNVRFVDASRKTFALQMPEMKPYKGKK